MAKDPQWALEGTSARTGGPLALPFISLIMGLTLFVSAWVAISVTSILMFLYQSRIFFFSEQDFCSNYLSKILLSIIKIASFLNFRCFLSNLQKSWPRGKMPLKEALHVHSIQDLDLHKLFYLELLHVTSVETGLPE